MEEGVVIYTDRSVMYSFLHMPPFPIYRRYFGTTRGGLMLLISEMFDTNTPPHKSHGKKEI